MYGRLDAGGERAQPAPRAGAMGNLIDTAHGGLRDRAAAVAMLAPGRRNLGAPGIESETNHVIATQPLRQR